jgi:CRP-like cAMP-binding protein
VNADVTLELIAQLETMAHLKLPDIDRIAAAVQVKQLASGECAFRDGERGAYVYVVRSGLLKQYYTDREGGQWIKSFTAEGDAFACMDALALGGVTSFTSEAIESSVIERVSYEAVARLADEHIEWQKALTHAYACLAQLKVRRERDLLMMSAEELYEQFVSVRPELAERIPQKDLAGYIGVTPVGLNRIVKRTRNRLQQ